MTLLLTGCVSEQAETAAIDMDTTHYSGCILRSSAAVAPGDLYLNSGVVPTDEYPPFTKKITVYGYTLVGRDDITDDFMLSVAQTIIETLPQSGPIDAGLQEEFVRNMYEYRALIPFYKGTDRITSSEDLAAWNVTRSQNSVCGVIMEAPCQGQVNEVIEHILHYANDLGLHYTFPEEWAVTNESGLYQFMLEAMEKEYYNIGPDDDAGEEDRSVRGKLQEFGYWIISTAWNLQEPYGSGHDELTIRNNADFQAKMPQLYAMYEQTVATIMVSPSLSTLEEFTQ